MGNATNLQLSTWIIRIFLKKVTGSGWYSLMSSMHIPSQEMDEGLENMWMESTEGISAIDPGTPWISSGECQLLRSWVCLGDTSIFFSDSYFI